MDSVSDVLVRWYRNGAGKGGEDAGTTLENNTFNVTDIVNLTSENKRVEAVEMFNETFKHFDKLTFEDKLDAAYRLNNANLKDLAKKAVEKLRESFDKLKTTDQRCEVVVADMVIVRDRTDFSYVAAYYEKQELSPELEDNIFRMIQCAVEMYRYIGMSPGKSGVHLLIKQMCILLAKTTMRFDMKIVKYLHANKLFSELDHYLGHTLTIRKYWTLDFSAVTENDVTYIQDLNPETLQYGKYYADALGRILQKDTRFNVTDIVNLMHQKTEYAIMMFNKTFQYFDKLTFEDKLDAAYRLNNANLKDLAKKAVEKLRESFDKLKTTDQRCEVVVADMEIVRDRTYFPYVAAYYEKQELSPKLEADMFEMIKCMVNARNDNIGIIAGDQNGEYGVRWLITEMCILLASRTRRFDMIIVKYLHENRLFSELDSYLTYTLRHNYETVDFSAVTADDVKYVEENIKEGEKFSKFLDESMRKTALYASGRNKA